MQLYFRNAWGRAWARLQRRHSRRRWCAFKGEEKPAISNWSSWKCPLLRSLYSPRDRWYLRATAVLIEPLVSEESVVEKESHLLSRAKAAHPETRPLKESVNYLGPSRFSKSVLKSAVTALAGSPSLWQTDFLRVFLHRPRGRRKHWDFPIFISHQSFWAWKAVFSGTPWQELEGLEGREKGTQRDLEREARSWLGYQLLVLSKVQNLTCFSILRVIGIHFETFLK